MSSTNRGASRITNDNYPTPATPIDALLGVLNIPHWISFHEPCRGTGAIYDRMRVLTRSHCEISEGIDYLTYNPLSRYDLIITNPPYVAAAEVAVGLAIIIMIYRNGVSAKIAK